MLRRAASVGSGGATPNRSSNSRIENGPICPMADRPSPHSEQENSVTRLMCGVARFVRVHELAVDETEDRAIGQVEQHDYHGRQHAELEAEEARAGQRRDAK